MEKEHLIRMKDLYGEDGDILLDKLEKGEQDFFADLLDADKRRDLIQLDEFANATKQRSGDIEKLVS